MVVAPQPLASGAVKILGVHCFASLVGHRLRIASLKLHLE
jgi:hypothetical protein